MKHSTTHTHTLTLVRIMLLFLLYKILYNKFTWVQRSHSHPHLPHGICLCMFKKFVRECTRDAKLWKFIFEAIIKNGSSKLLTVKPTVRKKCVFESVQLGTTHYANIRSIKKYYKYLHIIFIGRIPSRSTIYFVIET